MKETIQRILSSAAEVKTATASDEGLHQIIETAALECIQRLQTGGTVYACGNGGSTCDAMHFVEELVARYKRERPGFRAMHFMDPSTLTCWSNDYEFASAFERQAKTFCTDKDFLLAISTSGNSENILKAVEAAKAAGTFVFGMSGKGGGKLKDAADVCFVAPSDETERIQEVHITVIHILCELLETC